MKTRGPNDLILIAWVFFATIYQSPPMDGPWWKFANIIHAKPRDLKISLVLLCNILWGN